MKKKIFVFLLFFIIFMCKAPDESADLDPDDAGKTYTMVVPSLDLAVQLSFEQKETDKEGIVIRKIRGPLSFFYRFTPEELRKQEEEQTGYYNHANSTASDIFLSIYEKSLKERAALVKR